jgi:hypothetical protein
MRSVVFVLFVLLGVFLTAATASADWSFEYQGAEVKLIYTVDVKDSLSKSSASPGEVVIYTLGESEGSLRIYVRYKGYDIQSPDIPVRPGRREVLDIDTGIPFVKLRVSVMVNVSARLSAENAQLDKSEVVLPGEVKMTVGQAVGYATLIVRLYAAPVIGLAISSPVGDVNLGERKLTQVELKPEIRRSVEIAAPATFNVAERATGLLGGVGEGVSMFLILAALIAAALVPVAVAVSVFRRKSKALPREKRESVEGGTSNTVKSIGGESLADVESSFKPTTIEEVPYVEVKPTQIRPPKVERFEAPPISQPASEAYQIKQPVALGPVLVVEGTNSVFRIDGERVFGRPDFVAYVPGYKLMYISTRHFRVFKMGDEWFIEDLGSANGTFLNGVDIRGRGPQKLSDGDVISVAGEIKLVFRTS